MDERKREESVLLKGNKTRTFGEKIEDRVWVVLSFVVDVLERIPEKFEKIIAFACFFLTTILPCAVTYVVINTMFENFTFILDNPPMLQFIVVLILCIVAFIVGFIAFFVAFAFETFVLLVIFYLIGTVVDKAKELKKILS